MKTEDLRAFDAVVRHGSISEAARALHLTQPAITRRIQNLEEALGAQLLDRSTKPPHPSPLGLRVHEQTKAALREIDSLGRLVATDAEPSGTLRLGLTHSMGSTGLIEVLTGMKREFPEVNIEICTDWSARLVEKVAHGRLDAAAVFLPARALIPEGLSGERLAATDVVVVAAKGQFEAQAGKLSRYAEVGWILNPEGCGFRAALQRKLADLGLRFKLNLETFGSELQLGLVAAGLGVGFVSRPALLASHWRENLDVLTPRDFSHAVDVWLVGPAFHGHLHRAVEQFGRAMASGFATPTASRSPRRSSAAR
jgi:DNA-binding transcriptional LysR family regulator